MAIKLQKLLEKNDKIVGPSEPSVKPLRLNKRKSKAHRKHKVTQLSEKINKNEACSLFSSNESFSVRVEEQAEKWFEYELEPVFHKNKKMKVDEN